MISVERSSARPYVEKLRSLRRVCGKVYIDGLATTEKGDLARLFNAGVRSATRQQWDRAYREWTDAKSHAEGTQLAALDLLRGCCLAMRRRRKDAAVELSAALSRFEDLRDRTGMAVCRTALGRLARDSGDAEDAAGHFGNAGQMWRELNEPSEEARAMENLARAYAALGKEDRALESHRAALKLLEQTGDKVGASHQYGAIGLILAGRGEDDKARAAFEDGLHLARESGDRLTEAERLASIGRIHLKQGSWRRAQESLEKALGSFESAGREQDQALALFLLAETHTGNREADVAHEFYERALAMARRTGDRRLQALSLQRLARGLLLHGSLVDARKLLDESVTISKDVADAACLAEVLETQGELLLEQGEQDRAAGLLKEVLESVPEGQPSAVRARALTVLARIKRLQGAVDEALAQLSACRSEVEKAKEPVSLAELHSEEGMCRLVQEDSEAALRLLRKAVELRKQVGDRRGLGRELVNLGRALTVAGDPDGKRRIEEGLNLLHHSGTRRDESWSLRILAAANRANGNPPAAQRNLDRALELSTEAEDLNGEARSLAGLGRLRADDKDWAHARKFFGQALRCYERLGSEKGVTEMRAELDRLPEESAGVKFLDRDADGPGRDG